MTTGPYFPTHEFSRAFLMNFMYAYRDFNMARIDEKTQDHIQSKDRGFS